MNMKIKYCPIYNAIIGTEADIARCPCSFLITSSCEFNELVAEMETNFGKSVTMTEYKKVFDDAANDPDSDFTSMAFELAMFKSEKKKNRSKFLNDFLSGKLETEGKVDYTSEWFWKDAPDGALEHAQMEPWVGKFDYWLDSKGYWLDGEYYVFGLDVRGGLNFTRQDFTNITPRPVIKQTQPKPVYTQEMYDKGEQTPVGSEVMIWFNGDSEPKWDQITWYGVNNGHPCFVYKDEQCWPKTTDYKIKPIDTRTDEEKAIEDIANSLMLSPNRPSIKTLLHSIINGKIHGVTWSKGNE